MLTDQAASGIRVVQRGQPPEEKMYAATCSNCNSRLESLAGSLRATAGQYNETDMLGNCPVCGHMAYFTPKV